MQVFSSIFFRSTIGPVECPVCCERFDSLDPCGFCADCVEDFQAAQPPPRAFEAYCEERAALVERERAAAAEALEAERALLGCEIDRAKAIVRRASQVAAQEIATGHRPSGATAPSKAQQSRKAAAEEVLSRAESALGEAIEDRQALDFAYPAHYARWVSENN